MKSIFVCFLVTFFLMDSNQLQAGQTYEVSLAPGEGTILLLGTREDLKSVKRDYFSWSLFRSARVKSISTKGQYRLDFMPFGFYLGDHTIFKPAASSMGLDIWEWYGRLLKLLRGGGANTIHVQGGGYLEKEGELTAKVFAEFASKRGFKVIIEPGDVYFRGPGYFTEGSHWAASYENPEDHFRRAIEPRLREYLPKYRDGSRVFAWAPVEELPAEGEATFTLYKKLLRELLPGQLLFQLDSQQNNVERLKSKQPPYPDLSALDDYPWCHTHHEGGLSLWTPHYVARWLYSYLQPYAAAVHKLYGGQAIAVLQGPAEYSLYGVAEGSRYGWKPDVHWQCSTSPSVRWYPQHNAWGAFNRYLPPPHAERLSCWIAVCAGFKGVMLWSAVTAAPERQMRAIIEGDKSPAGISVRHGIIHYDFTTTPQWQELAATWQELKKLERLILALEPSETAYASSTEGNLFLNSFTDAKGRRYLVVVNGLIGEWDGHSPDWLDYPRTKLSLGMDGNLINYTPLTKARNCKVALSDNATVFDVRKLVQ